MQLYREPRDEAVARFISDGMVLPVQVDAVGGDGTCRAQLYGHTVRMRCKATQRPTKSAVACLRPRDLTVIDSPLSGLQVLIERGVYQGGFFRLQTHLAAMPGVTLQLAVPQTFDCTPGRMLKVDVADGWIIPTVTDE
jgi:iron(III) transport system ATP-binding protein